VPPSIFFKLLIPIQYILSLIYFNKSHFDDFYLKDRKSIHLECLPNTKLIIIGIIIISLISSLLTLILKILSIDFDNNLDPFNYYNQSLDKQIFINIFDILQLLYGRSILFINTISFIIVFCKHIKIIDNLLQILNNKIYNGYDIKGLTFFCRQVTKIRYEMHKSIKLLEKMFSMSTIIGGFSCGYIIDNYKSFNIGEISIISFIIFIITQCAFFYIIYKLANQKEQLLTLINSPLISRKFLSRFNNKYLDCYIEQSDINQQKMNCNLSLIVKMNKLTRIEKDNATSLDWLILNNILNQKWTEFSICGISLHNGNVLKQGFLFGTFLVIILKHT